MKEPYTIQRDIDRLIDGELNEQAKTKLLQRCESEPEAWRTMALALLEAREIKQALGELLADNSLANHPSSAALIPDRAGRKSRWILTIAAACVAFVAGWFVPKPSSDLTPTAPLVTDTMPSESQAKPEPISQSDGLAVVGFAQIYNLAGKEPPVPVIAGANLDYAALLQQSPKVPERVRRQYKNQGLAVVANRRVMSLELADGQRFAIPLDKLGVRFVGHEVL